MDNNPGWENSVSRIFKISAHPTLESNKSGAPQTSLYQTTPHVKSNKTGNWDECGYVEEEKQSEIYLPIFFDGAAYGKNSFSLLSIICVVIGGKGLDKATD